MLDVYVDLFITFFKIGLFTIGGGYAMITLIQQEIINHGWLSLKELIDIIAISEMTPGPFAVNSATFVGIKTAGLTGALFGTAGVIVPSFIIVILVAKYFTHFKDYPMVQSLLYGLRPAVIGLILSSALIIGKTAFIKMDEIPQVKNSLSGVIQFAAESVQWRSLLIFGIILVGGLKFKIHPVFLILLSGLLGILLFGPM